IGGRLTMSVAAVLVNPSRFKRPPPSVEIAIGEDLLRTITLLVEDLIAEGPLGAALLRSVDGLGARMQTQVQARFGAVRDRMRVPLLGVVDYVKSLSTQAAGADDPEAAFALALRLLGDLEA